MFCSICGAKCIQDAKFCASCGAHLTLAKEQMIDVIPPHIREKIKSFKKLETLTCLECGYHGMMGVKAIFVPWYLSWWTLISLIIISIPFGGIGIVPALFLGLYRAYEEKYVVDCPNCNTELTTK